jgi:hypothetical protein
MPSTPPPQATTSGSSVSSSKVRYQRLAFWAITAVVTCTVLVCSVRWLVDRWQNRNSASDSLRARPALLLSIRELARLEAIELHLEKVIDLTQKQSRFFGLIATTDAILLVAAGDVTLGVDLSKVRDQDLAFDPETRAARLVLPAPEVFSARLDEKQTYTYTRVTGLLARRDEQLEARARQAALEAIVKATESTDARERAKVQVERTLRMLLSRTGASEVSVAWR